MCIFKNYSAYGQCKQYPCSFEQRVPYWTRTDVTLHMLDIPSNTQA